MAVWPTMTSPRGKQFEHYLTPNNKQPHYLEKKICKRENEFKQKSSRHPHSSLYQHAEARRLNTVGIIMQTGNISTKSAHFHALCDAALALKYNILKRFCLLLRFFFQVTKLSGYMKIALVFKADYYISII